MKVNYFFHRDEIPGLTTILIPLCPDHLADCDAENSSSIRSFLPPDFLCQLYIDQIPVRGNKVERKGTL